MNDHGKADFDDVHNRDDALGYDRTLGALDYRVPQHGADIVGDLIDTCFSETSPTVLDVCCSYGVAGALLKTDLDLDDLNKRYDALLSGADRTPWVAAFCLRAYDYQPIIDCLAEHGLQTETTERHFPQRRFADAEEKHWAIEQTRDNDLEPRGLETDGYYYADFFLSRDPASIAHRPLESLLAG